MITYIYLFYNLISKAKIFKISLYFDVVFWDKESHYFDKWLDTTQYC